MNSLVSKIDAYKAALDRLDEAQKHLDLIKEDIQQLKDELTAEMVQEEVTSISRGDFTYSLVSKTKFSKIAGKEEELFNVLRENGLGDLIQETVNAQRFNSAMNAEAENNEGELPEVYNELVNKYSFFDISKRKKAKK